MLEYSDGERGNIMRKFLVAFFFFALVLGGISVTVYARDCADDTLLDRFGDWFGNLGKTQKKKNENIAIRKANRLADCADKKKALAADGDD